MIAYLDSSVFLRVVLGEPGRLREWETIRQGVSSALTEVECLRTLDRLQLRYHLAPPEIAGRRSLIFELLESVSVVEITRPVLTRASQPFPTPLGTLDAIHLATAFSWREQNQTEITMATHDGALALAARASGLKVLGAP